jgi:hypothetical protein
MIKHMCTWSSHCEEVRSTNAWHAKIMCACSTEKFSLVYTYLLCCPYHLYESSTYVPCNPSVMISLRECIPFFVIRSIEPTPLTELQMIMTRRPNPGLTHSNGEVPTPKCALDCRCITFNGSITSYTNWIMRHHWRIIHQQHTHPPWRDAHQHY